MKYRCKWCNEEITISQSDYAKTGLKLLKDHEEDCFKSHYPNFGQDLEKILTETDGPEVPARTDTQGIIKYLHELLGRIPTEGETLRFRMFLNAFPYAPSKIECEDFVKLLKVFA